MSGTTQGRGGARAGTSAKRGRPLVCFDKLKAARWRDMTDTMVIADGIILRHFTRTRDFTTIDLIAATTSALNGALLIDNPPEGPTAREGGLMAACTHDWKEASR
jgi:hypothetical protein